MKKIILAFALVATAMISAKKANAQSPNVPMVSVSHVPPAVFNKVQLFMENFEVAKKHKLDRTVAPSYYVHGGTFTVILRYYVNEYFTDDYFLILNSRGEILFQ